MTDQPSSAANADMIDYWNAGAGETWVELQTLLDRQIQPLGAAAMQALAVRPGEQVLDIGCGCGESTLELAARTGSDGRVTGVDISQPMLEVARGRARGAADFIEADAQTQDLGTGRFDAVYSRFGVMFFDDPARAFANIRKALKHGGRLAFVCWRTPAENPIMIVPMVAAAPLLPPQPQPDPLAPGPFAFADAQRVRGILEGAGFADVAIEPFDAKVGAGDLDDVLTVAFKVGPLGRLLRENPELREGVVEAVRDAVSAYVTEDGVKMGAAVWIVTARNP